MKNKKPDVRHNILQAFEALSKKDNYKLTKIKSKRHSMIREGEFVIGKFMVFELENDVVVLADNSAGNRSTMNDPTYIRTSPIVGIIDKSSTSVTFETEGGFYKIEKMKAKKT